jgi:hypothetical protein
VGEPVGGDPSEGGIIPPLNDRELAVIEALGQIGLSGQRAENPGRNAYIWVPVGDRGLYVGAYAIADDRSSFNVTKRRTFNELTIEVGNYAGDDRTLEGFTCNGIRYYLNGDLPPGFNDLSTLVDQFAEAVQCA